MDLGSRSEVSVMIWLVILLGKDIIDNNDSTNIHEDQRTTVSVRAETNITFFFKHEET
jgi:hypothetical protein